MNRIAVIVIGSNSARMLCADTDTSLSNPTRHRIESRLFLHLSQSRRFPQETIEQTAEDIRRLQAIAAQEHSVLIGVYATSAVRDAENSDALAHAIFSACGLPLQIISGAEEARFSLLGSAGYAPGAVIDIGGGSTELAYYDTDMHPRCLSLQLGASRLFSVCPIHEAADVQKALAAARNIIMNEPSVPASFPAGSAVYLVGGTGTASARMIARTDAAEGVHLHRDQVRQLLTQIAPLTPLEREMIPGCPKGRGNILPTGLAILCAVMDFLHLS